MNLQVFYRDVYGKTLCYPANVHAVHISHLTGTRTLDPRHLAVAKELGHTIEVVPAPPRIAGLPPTQGA